MSELANNTRPPLVLIAHEQEWSARSLESILGPQGFAVLRALSGQQAIALARSASPDAIILEARMSDLDGIEVCRTLRGDASSLNTPIIITASDPGSRAERLEAYRAGAWEFCTQPVDDEVLLLKLRSFVQSKWEADRLRTESLLDHSTGFYTVRGLAHRAREIGAAAHRRHEALACIAVAPHAPGVADLELHAKWKASPASGAFRGLIARGGRESDAIGHLGETELAIIAPATRAEGAVRLVERLRDAMAASPLEIDGTLQRLTLRAGYCAVRDFASSSVDAVEMLLRAATALSHLRVEGIAEGIQAFDELPVKSAR